MKDKIKHIMKKIIFLSLTFLLGTLLLFVSRFWFLDFFARQSDALAKFMRQFLPREFATLELLVWICLAFLILSLAQKIYDRFIGH